MPKILQFIFYFFIFLLLFILFYFFIGSPPEKNVIWGVNFSQMHSENLDLNWRENYRAVLDDLGAKNIKIITNWDFAEPQNNHYNFQDIDWQIEEAEKRKASLIYVAGMKTGRWPECHIPGWAKALSKKEQQEAILKYLERTILRYKNNSSIIAWQVENEPFFRFGECPWYDREFFKKEVELVKSLDSSRPVIVSESGEYSLWLGAAETGDVVGTTMYRRVWVKITDKIGFYMPVLFTPHSYWRKTQLVEKLFGKKVINIELQAEPWMREVYGDISLAEQEETMSLEKFKDNIDFAKKSGLDTFYLWGVEWMYWMEEKHNRPEIWEEAKKLF